MFRAREMIKHLRTVADFPEELSSAPSTHVWPLQALTPMHVYTHMYFTVKYYF